MGKKHADHLIKALKSQYKISEDWTGGLYCGIDLKWDYEKRILDIAMPGYVKKQLQKYNHIARKKQNCPYKPAEKKYGKDAQNPLPDNTSPRLDEKGIKKIQQIVGSILYYARAVDLTTLIALSSIASEQTTATEKTMSAAMQLLDYLASNPNATIRYYASDMVSNIHSDASYLSERKG